MSGTSLSAARSELPIRITGAAVSVVLFFAAWSLFRLIGDTGDVLPSVGQLWLAAKSLLAGGSAEGRSFWFHLGATSWRLIVAWIGGVALGSAVGYALGANRTVHQLVDPLISFMKFLVPAGRFKQPVERHGRRAGTGCPVDVGCPRVGGGLDGDGNGWQRSRGAGLGSEDILP